jgi:hypothetical protein
MELSLLVHLCTVKYKCVGSFSNENTKRKRTSCPPEK